MQPSSVSTASGSNSPFSINDILAKPTNNSESQGSTSNRSVSKTSVAEPTVSRERSPLRADTSNTGVPETTIASRKTKTQYTHEQLTVLWGLYVNVSSFPPSHARSNAAIKANLSTRQVRKWFENVRYKIKQDPNYGNDWIKRIRASTPQAATLGASPIYSGQALPALSTPVMPQQFNPGSLHYPVNLNPALSTQGVGIQQPPTFGGNPNPPFYPVAAATPDTPAYNLAGSTTAYSGIMTPAIFQPALSNQGVGFQQPPTFGGNPNLPFYYHRGYYPPQP